jgi:hypothetical protein
LGLFQAVAGDVQLQYHAVVDQPVDRGGRRHGVFEDLLPFPERQVARQEDAAAFVTFRKQCEQHLHLLPALLHVADVVDDQRLEPGQLLEHFAQLEIPFGDQQFLHQQAACPKGDLAA